MRACICVNSESTTKVPSVTPSPLAAPQAVHRSPLPTTQGFDQRAPQKAGRSQRSAFPFGAPASGANEGDVGTIKAPNVGLHRLFAILTTEPNDTVAPIHDKAMPVQARKARAEIQVGLEPRIRRHGATGDSDARRCAVGPVRGERCRATT